MVERLGGSTAAILSVVLIKDRATNEGSIFYLSNSTASIPFYSLTDYVIPSLQPSEVDLSKARKINPTTILPEEIPLSKPKAKFDDHQSFRHFEDSGALDFGLHEADNRRFTTALRLPELFEYCGKDIWKSIKEHIPNNAIIATTYGRQDLCFHSFISENVKNDSRKINSVFMPKSDSIYSDFSYFLTLPSQIKLEGQHVILLLSSLHTSEKLRKLVSLLSMRSIGRITVICLLNRMGPRTINFISRIRKLFYGVHGTGNPTTNVVAKDPTFEFVAVYNISDIKNNDIVRMHQTVNMMADDYIRETPEPSFRNMMKMEVRYFAPYSITTRRFEYGKPRPLSPEEPTSLLLDNVVIDIKSKDGKLFCLNSHAVSTRNYSEIINSVRRETDKNTLYQLFAVLLSDVSYLRIARQFNPLRRALIDTVRTERRKRLEIESSINSATKSQNEKNLTSQLLAIEECVEIETFFLFGLSLFSYLDQSYSKYEKFILEILTSGNENPEDWNETPNNFLAYYGNERILWTVSLLLHFTLHNYRDLKQQSDFKVNLKKVIDSYIKFIGDIESDKKWNNIRESLRAETLKIKNSFNSILKELGVHEQKRKHQIIRFLHNQLIEPKEQHNPLIKSLKNTYDNLRTNYTNSKEKLNLILEQRLDFPKTKRFPFSGYKEEVSQIKRKIDDAIYAATLLEGIAESANRLFHFHPVVNKEEAARYISGIELAGMTADVAQLRVLLEEIGSKGSISDKQLTLFHRLRTNITNEISLSESPLVKALLWYIVPLVESFRVAMQDANTFLSVDYSNVWGRGIDKLSKLKEHEVLIDQMLLKETLWNICTNVRYGLNQARASGVTDFSSLVDFKIEELKDSPAPLPEVDTVDYIILRVFSPPDRSYNFNRNEARSTLEKQSFAIEQFGGSLRVESNNAQFEVALKLISRRDVKQAWDIKQRLGKGQLSSQTRLC